MFEVSGKLSRFVAGNPGAYPIKTLTFLIYLSKSAQRVLNVGFIHSALAVAEQ